MAAVDVHATRSPFGLLFRFFPQPSIDGRIVHPVNPVTDSLHRLNVRKTRQGEYDRELRSALIPQRQDAVQLLRD